MASPLNRKPLNPRAPSWFPDAKKPSQDFTPDQKLPVPLPHEIYGTVPPHVSPVIGFELFPQPHPAVMFQAPHQGSLQYAPMQHKGMHFGFMTSYPIYPFLESYPEQASGCDTLLEKKDDEVKDGTMEKVAEYTDSLKQILGISEGQRGFKKFVPPRLRKNYFEEQFQGRKKLPRKVWKLKNSDNGFASTQIVPLASLPREERPVCEKTTVMLKNIPNQYRRDSFIEFLNKKCLELHVAYDFLYLPMDFIKGNNLGFAFVNITTASAAMKMKSALEGYKWGQFCIPNGKFFSKKILQTTWARIQGKDALVRHFQNSCFSCEDIEYLPVVILPPRKGTSNSTLIAVGRLKGFCASSNTAKEITTTLLQSLA